MKEIEVKAKITTVEIFKEKLEKLGCRFGEALIQEDSIFFPIGIGFPDIVKDTPIVRVRDSNGTIMLTMKKRVTGDNELIKLEKEVVVSDKQETMEIVEHMGFYMAASVHKKRIECAYEGMTICIDEVAELGNFIEVEKLSEADNDTEIQDELFEFLRSLGVSDNDRATKGYDILLNEKTASSESKRLGVM
ncbi:MAG: class IV adenylate cyclase [Patescibacteria group bacterium]